MSDSNKLNKEKKERKESGKFNYIIYHKGCLDGFSGFFVAHISGKLSKNVTIFPDVPSATMVPPDIDDKDIVIIDVAYKKEILEIIFQYARSVVFIDHHVSIKDDVNDLYKKYNKNQNITIVYDQEKSGSTIAWKYFFKRQEIPLFLKYVEDQDTGTWKYPETKRFIFALKTYYHLSTENKSLNKWFRLLNKEYVEKMVKRGKHMEKYNNHLVNVNIPKHSLERFPSKKIYDLAPEIFKQPGQYKVAVYCGLNCPSVTDLALGAFEKLECDFCIMWTYNLDTKKYVLSMRSKSVDVSKICKIFGGGGHELASACSFYAKDYVIDDLFFGQSLPRSMRD